MKHVEDKCYSCFHPSTFKDITIKYDPISFFIVKTQRFKLMFNYSEEFKDHFKNPRNWGTIEDADGKGEVENPSCGDKVWIYLKIEGDRIKDIKFQTTGCAPVVATSSMITEMAKGKTIEEALEISRTDVEEKAGKLPPIKMYGPNLSATALKAALDNYLEKKKNKN